MCTVPAPLLNFFSLHPRRYVCRVYVIDGGLPTSGQWLLLLLLLFSCFSLSRNFLCKLAAFALRRR